MGKNDIVFLKVGQQYIKSSIYLMKAICRSGNQTGAIADTIEEAHKIMGKKVELSDLTLFQPALFDCYHGLELYIKGLLYLKNCTNISLSHEVNDLLNELRKYYNNTKLFNLIEETYTTQNNMVDKFKKENNIINQKEFYEALRYPLSKGNKLYNYDKLRYNGREGIKEIKNITKKLKEIDKLVVLEYQNNSNN